jgi:hypothetical protein
MTHDPSTGPTADDVAALAARRGLKLDAADLADMGEAVRVMRQLVALLPRDLPYAAEPAHIFPPPLASRGEGE